MRIILCDRCRRETQAPAILRILSPYRRPSDPEQNIELCQDCYNLVDAIINNEEATHNDNQRA